MIAANLWYTLCAVAVVGKGATSVDGRPAFPELPS